MSPQYSLLDLVNTCDSFPYPTDPNYAATFSPLVHFRIADLPNVTLGLILPDISQTFANLPDWSLELHSMPRTLTLLSGTDVASRSAVMHKTILAMRATGHFEILSKWRDEQYGVYGPGGELLLTLERAASQLFGVVTYGAHMIAYRRASESPGDYLIWVPRRAKTKQTFPSMLDNSVAGGITVGEGPWESIVREADEEASLPRSIAEKAVSVGAVTYFYVSGTGSGGEDGLMQPECQFLFDLDLTGADIELKPNDTEVESFKCMSVKEVKECLKQGEFKPNCAIVTIDFLIRHGLMTPEDEPQYVEILTRIHRRLEFPIASFIELEKKGS
jgi:isopentenyldiphosphate isomerase